MAENILELLRFNKLIPSQTDNEKSANKKEQVLKQMLVALKDWSENYLKMMNHPVEVLEKNHVMLFTSGSYALGLSDCESDLDLVCLASKLIDRNDFFDTIKSSIQSQLEVKNFQALTLNRCPLIKMVVNNVKIDLTLAIWSVEQVNVDIKGGDDDDHLLSGMEELDVLSINGPRNMMTIKHMVPDLHVYRSVLISIKLWARRRLIYSHSIGYLGGGAWSVMVAYICCEYHGLTQLMMMKKFFEIFSEWSWPKPVQLKELSNKIQPNYHPWNPKDDYQHLMPIILPCFPETNSAFNVNNLTRSTIMEELKRGASILHDVYEVGSEFLKLFEDVNFFGKFRIFLIIIFRSQNNEDHLRWSGLIESRIRFILNDLSKISMIKSLIIYPNQFLYAGDDNDLLTKWHLGLVVEPRKDGRTARLDLSKEIEKFKSLVYNSAREYAWNKGGVDLEVLNVVKSKGDINGEAVKDYLPERDKHLIRCS